MLAQATWQTISWRTGTKGKLKARFAAVRVRVADGPRRGIRGKTRQGVPGEEVWLVGEHRASGGEEILSCQPTGESQLAHSGGNHQGALDL